MPKVINQGWIKGLPHKVHTILCYKKKSKMKVLCVFCYFKLVCVTCWLLMFLQLFCGLFYRSLSWIFISKQRLRPCTSSVVFIDTFYPWMTSKDKKIIRHFFSCVHVRHPLSLSVLFIHGWHPQIKRLSIIFFHRWYFYP